MKRLAAILLLLAFLASPAPARAAGICGTTYIVKKGDTLWSIAEKCKVNWTVLLGVNYQIDDPSVLSIGQVIRTEAEVKIPTDNPVDPGAPKLYDGRAPGIQPDGTYLVGGGDSLARIAEIYAITVDELRRLNPAIGADYVIYPGQTLVLPPGASELPGNARRDGFVGVSSLLIFRGRSYNVNITDFPPFADIDVRLVKVGSAPARTYDALTDAVGNAFLTITIPYSANKNESWIIQVVTTEFSMVHEGFSAVMTVVQ